MTAALPKRKGYSRRSDISPTVLRSLNEGREETITLVEWLAIDMSVLVQHAARAAGLDGHAEALAIFAQSVAKEGVTQRLSAIAEHLHKALAEHPRHDSAFEALATHTSDMIRAWACLSLRADESIPLPERLDRLRRFASDGAMSVRECAWDSFRPFVAEDLEFGIRLLEPWVQDADPAIRRCAIEGTRPCGVWTRHIVRMKDDPALGLPLLEPVRNDPDRYVGRAVANWINDASKSRPDWVLDLARRWLEGYPTADTRWIVNHSLRTLRKQGRA